MSSLDAAFIRAFDKKPATGGPHFAPSEPDAEPAEPPRSAEPIESTADDALPTLRIAEHTIDAASMLLSKKGPKAPLSSYWSSQAAAAGEQATGELPPSISIAERGADEKQLLPELVAQSTSEFKPWSALLAPSSQAAFQVDRFRLPGICEELLQRLSPQFDQLCEQLQAGARMGRKMLAVAGAVQRAGATTLSLCMATRAAAHGMSVALVDGNIANPQLAAQLGVAPELGWHEALRDELPAWEAWIESRLDHWTLVPLAGAVGSLPPRIAAKIPAMLGQARAQFDVVLIDIGRLTGADTADVWLEPPVDGLLIVEDVRKAGQPLGDLKERFGRAMPSWWALAENFVTSE